MDRGGSECEREYLVLTFSPFLVEQGEKGLVASEVESSSWWCCELIEQSSHLGHKFYWLTSSADITMTFHPKLPQLIKPLGDCVRAEL